MRVVFDTNIFISAFVIPGSQAEKAMLKIIEGEDVLLLSKGILDELLSVLSIKFSRDKEEISRVAVILSEIAEWVEPSESIKALRDEPDNRILECAVSGNADIIVTGDKEILRLGEYEKIKIISLKEYLEKL
ncbi:MAG: putative toxin-antitoxin system toxin component, PIN family [Deltaproteobacteria bacterium]|nr:putative toxin-antitoxin system toxin component, PIN family [Deltaproteobacteria bacterium]